MDKEQLAIARLQDAARLSEHRCGGQLYLRNFEVRDRRF